MANTFKSAVTGSSTSVGAFYTCPAATTAVVHAVYLSNVDGTNDETINLKSGNAVIIDKGAFHRTSSDFGKDIIVMEIETPTNKNDIGRYQDEYKRSNSGYETKESFSVAKNHDTLLNFNNIKNKPGTVGNCVIKVINSKAIKISKPGILNGR